jgi:hypothetical protein
MNPQGDPTHQLSTLHTQQPPNSGSKPTAIPILQLSSPQPTLPKEYIPFTVHSPFGLNHSFIGASSALSWPRMSYLGILGTLSCFRVLLTAFTRLLSHFLNRKTHHMLTAQFASTRASFPTYTQPNNGYLQAQNGRCSSQHTDPLLLSKICK